jgi:hypothetical protein
MWKGTVVSIHVAAEASVPMRSIAEVRAFRDAGSRAIGISPGPGSTRKTRASAGAKAP